MAERSIHLLDERCQACLRGGSRMLGEAETMSFRPRCRGTSSATTPRLPPENTPMAKNNARVADAAALAQLCELLGRELGGLVRLGGCPILRALAGLSWTLWRE